jgi:FkbM family methyltransferase
MAAMPSLKRKLKKVAYGSLPGLRGAFPYFGALVYFPRGSLLFGEACEQGIFEAENVQLLRAMMKPGTWMFDVGANIGLMALPVLKGHPDCKVLSFEPSPNSLPWLERTINESPYRERWSLVKKAAGAAAGSTDFCVSPPQAGAYDSVVNTRRIAGSAMLQVEMTTLDDAWRELDSPAVSVIKIDVEGWEAKVLEGAKALLQAQRPRILLEWQATNLAAAGIKTSVLLDVAQSLGYRILTVPEFLQINDPDMLELQMLRNETFLLSPEAGSMNLGTPL